MRMHTVEIPSITVGNISDRGVILVFDEATPDLLSVIDWTDFKRETGTTGILAFEGRVEIAEASKVVDGVPVVTVEAIAEALR